jgi:phage-related minor tail protein
MRTGFMGEAGPEAIMPLRRGRDGNLGVMSRWRWRHHQRGRQR